jgi:hypothetical protein
MKDKSASVIIYNRNKHSIIKSALCLLCTKTVLLHVSADYLYVIRACIQIASAVGTDMTIDTCVYLEDGFNQFLAILTSY